MAQANNPATSLELLSARVCVRKALTLAASGDTSLKTMKAVATSIARSSCLFQGVEEKLLNKTYRWSPPKPVDITSSQPLLCDPSLTLTIQQRWATRYNKDLMQHIHSMIDDFDEYVHTDRLVEVRSASRLPGFRFDLEPIPRVFVICEMSARTCHSLELHRVDLDEDADGEGWRVSAPLSFQSSIECIAETYDAVDAARKTGGVSLKAVYFELGTLSPLTFKTFYETEICKLRLKRHTKKTSEPGESHDPDGSEASDELDANELQDMIDELHGTTTDGSLDEFEQELASDQQYQDLADMDNLNAKFVAHALDKRQEGLSQGSSNSDRDREGDVTNQRSFEDELGEEVLHEFLLGSGKSHKNTTEARKQEQTKLTQAQIDDALYNWSNKVKQSLDACKLMAAGLNQFESSSPAATIARDVSLVLRNCGVGDAAEVSYVSWVPPHPKLQGRMITLDDTSSVMYPSHFTAEKYSFANSIMIVPLTGARVRKQQREQMPSLVRRLHSMFSVSTDASADLGFDDDFSFDIGETRQTCLGCRTSGDVRQCAFCLQCWHPTCGEQSAAFVNSFVNTNDLETLADTGLTTAELPFVFLPHPQTDFSIWCSDL